MSSTACIKWIKIGSLSFKSILSVRLLLTSSQVDCTNSCIASLIFLAFDLVINPSGTCKGSLRLGPPWFPSRADPGVSLASPWARATPHPWATKMEKKIYTIHTKKNNCTYASQEKKNYIHKIKLLLEGKKYIQKILGKNKKINQYTGGAKINIQGKNKK